MAVVAGLVISALGPAIEIVKLVGRPIARQFNYLCCFTSNINSLKDEAQSLGDAIAGLEAEVEIARDRRQEKPVPEVETWLTESKKIKDEINGIVNEATSLESGCSALVARFSISRRAKKTTDRTILFRKGKNFEVKFQQGPPAARQAVQLGNTYEFESRNKIEEDIMTALRGGEVHKIGIHGMGGLGKTTMAKKIMNRALEKVFVEVVFATVSQNVIISKIQDEIGGSLGLDKLKEETSQSGRAQLLLSRLNDTKRTLLVLDDIWEEPPLESIGIPCDSKWCTILYTSRNRDVLRAMDVQVHGMVELSEDEAWSFFRERVGTFVDDRKLSPTANEVAKKCGGLPIILAAVSGSLKGELDAAIWKDTLGNLEQSVPPNVRYNKESYNPLKWSYDRLDSKEAQSVFLLCCLFPEDADIPLDYLTYFSMGLRHIAKGIKNVEAARNSMRKLTKDLKDRSLLLDDGEDECVRMHDVIRDVCIIIAKEEGCIAKEKGGFTGKWISSSHLVGESYELLSKSRCPNLDLVFLDRLHNNDSLVFNLDDASVQGIIQLHLHVLCIQNYDTFTTFPRPTQTLGNLKTLILEYCVGLKTISAVGELVNLEILICRKCRSIEELPSEMKVLTHLKVLELMACSNLKSIGRGIISSLVALEELTMLESFNGWEAENKEERKNVSIKELEALTKLACLQIDIKHPSILTEDMPILSKKKIARFIIRTDVKSSVFLFSKTMKLWLERESHLGDWIEKQLLIDTEYLGLRGDGANNVDLSKIQNLRWLELRECESMKNIATTSSGSDDATVFPSLEHLELDSLPELQEICDGPISSTSFQYLNELKLNHLKALTQFWMSRSVCGNNNVPHFSYLSSIEIWNCDRLHNLGQLSMAGKDCLPYLQQLKILFCKIMEQVFLWNDDQEAGENKTSILITKVFPKLKEMNLYGLPNLTTFYQGIECIEFPLLTKVEIESCPKMKSIIDGSSSADFDEDDGYFHLFCQPQKISFGSSLKVLEMDHNPFCGHQIPSSPFNGLEKLNINDCVGSMSLFTLSVAANLVTLRELIIRSCYEMIKVIEDEQQQHRILLFPKLEILQLEALPKLVRFCKSKCEIEFPLLKKVEISKCPNMKNFSLGLIATPNVEALETDLSTYVGVGVDVAFHSLKKLEISYNNTPLYGDKISVSLSNRLEKLMFTNTSKGCMSLFSSSVIGNLVNLRVLDISNCKEIVKVIEDEEEKVVSGGEIIRSVVFPKLEELHFWNLPKLERFCKWKCDVEFPSLTQVDIMDCPTMESLSMGFIAAPNLKTVQINFEKLDAKNDLNGVLHQYYLAHHERYILFRDGIIRFSYNPFYGHEIPSLVFIRLKDLTISEYEGSMSLFTLSMAANLVSLTKLSLRECAEVIKVIEDEDQQPCEVEFPLFPKLEKLYLQDLPKLETFSDSKCEVEFPLFRKVHILRCPNMQKLSLGLVATPNLEGFTTDLTTYVGVGVDIAFNSLKELKVRENENPFDHHKISVFIFNGLEQLLLHGYKGSVSLFSPSAVGNLVNLKKLVIERCDEIVKVIEDEEEEKEDGIVVSCGEFRTLVFPKLEVLALVYLPKLESFCKWKCDVELPSLTELMIRECPNMENFSMGFLSAPNLAIVEIDYHEEIDATNDLNGALQQHYLYIAHQQKEEEE